LKPFHSQVILALVATISSASAQLYSPYGLAAPLVAGHGLAAPLVHGGLVHAPALAAPLIAGAAYQTGDYSRVSTVHGVHPGVATLAAPLGAYHAAPLHAGLVAPAVASSVRYTATGPIGLAGHITHGGLRLIK
jgi:hypothetical protein